MTASELKASILDQAIRGKLVPQDPTDEPAGELLKRIAAEKAKLPMKGRGRTQAAQSPITDDEKPFDIPEGWVWCRLGELLTNRDGERVPLSLAERSKHQNKKYDYYGASGVIDKVEGYLFDKPLLLIGEDGANLLTRNTPIAFIAQSGKYWVNNHAHVLDCSVFEVLRYVEVYINAISLAPYVTGTAQPKMNQEKMNSIPIPLPPLAEQKRIVAKIEELMPLVERYGKAETRRRELVASLPTDLKKSILQEAIQGRLTASWRNEAGKRGGEGETAAELLKRIKTEKAKLIAAKKIKKEKPLAPITDDEKPFEIPEGWEWCRLGEVGYSVGGLWVGEKAPCEKVGVLRAANFTKSCELDFGKMVYIDVEVKKLKSRTLEPGDIIVEKSGGGDNQPVGRAVLFNGFEKKCSFCNFTTLFRLVEKGAIAAEYLHTYLRYAYNVGMTIPMQSNTTNLRNLDMSMYLAMPIPLPPLAEQKRIAARVEELLAVVDKMENSIRSARG